ncbi:[LSU ribosomal protein L11P]-lysine N-methyltransferase [Oceanobacillus limi]|uniref:Ribosomal protein L11 methyltransferase n=2 Tax=Oceanobacillus limi TaxID=930131 RepID=A0A1I0FT87_9BACI|nr:[LSU ribosomal protein L11P]-lysine N-methyltransferase [Oceanobacillus limi]
MDDMKWTEICIHTTNDAVEPISNILHEAGASGVVIEDPKDLFIDRDTSFGEVFELRSEDYPKEGVYLKAYLPVTSFLAETVEEIKQSINALIEFDFDIGHNQVTLSEVREEDWATAWKKYYKPINISKKITITPTWEDYIPRSDQELVIELDPGMAFGTGTHPTTILSIQALEAYLQKNDTVIDVGCGSGVLSIASVLLGAKKVHAYDLDEIAVKSTSVNAKVNKVDDQIDIKQNNLLNNVAIQADVIVSNILAEIIVRFISDAWNNLRSGGLFITSGIIQNKKTTVIDALEVQGFEIVEINELEDWVSITAKKK